MANELRHGSVGTELTQAEWESITGHSFDAQVTGDIPYASSATQLRRLAIGTAGQILSVAGGIPAWLTTLVGGYIFSAAVTFNEIIVSDKGISFPATQVASANVNTLDDYEEGTWTPALTMSTVGDLSVAYSSQSGEYIKVGKLVYITAEISTSTWTHTTASGNLTITGLPFTVSTGIYPQGALTFQGITKANYTQFMVVPWNGGTTALVAASAQGQSVDNVQVASVPSGTQQLLRFTCIYKANA